MKTISTDLFSSFSARFVWLKISNTTIRLNKSGIRLEKNTPEEENKNDTSSQTIQQTREAIRKDVQENVLEHKKRTSQLLHSIVRSKFRI